MTRVPARLRVCLNGRMVPLAAARVPVFDRGFLFGDGIYETLRAYGGVPFRMGAHLSRLAASARRLSFRVPVPSAALGRAVAETLAANRLRDARVRIVVTRGTGLPELGATERARPAWLVYALPYEPPSAAAYQYGVRAIVASVVRNDRRSVDPAIKASSMLNNMLAVREAARAGAREAVMLNPSGFVAEASTANVFWVRNGVLFTPSLDCGILEGVTRGIVIGLARKLGVRVREGRFRPAALCGAGEAFVTASTIEVLPLAALGSRRFPRERPVTGLLALAYRAVVRSEVGG